MAEILKVQLEDADGNVYYLHTDASVVFCEDGTSVQTKLEQKIDKSSIIQNATTAALDKVVSAAVVKDIQDQVNEQNTKIGSHIIPCSVSATVTSKKIVLTIPFNESCGIGFVYFDSNPKIFSALFQCGHYAKIIETCDANLYSNFSCNISKGSTAITITINADQITGSETINPKAIIIR